MRSRRKRKYSTYPLFPILFMSAALFVTVALFRQHIGIISQAGEQAAIFSAALHMPDAGIDLLAERFRGFAQREIEAQPVQHVPEWPPLQVTDYIPQPALQVESSPPLQEAVTRVPPRIPAQYAAPIISENFSGYDGGSWIKWRSAFINNETSYSDDDIIGILETPWSTALDGPSEPQILILHTHATESFESHDRELFDTRNTWRSTDNSINMAAVGAELAGVLEENGVAVLHDTTQHDYPSYNGSYERAAKTISAYLEEYPSIKIVLDLHRDAMPRDDAIVKPVAMINGEKAAQVMIIASCDNGTVGVPEWRENLRFASLFQDYMERGYPGLTRPIFLCYRKYNMNLTTGSLLVEIGSNANTLEEAMRSARMVGQALSDLFWDLSESD